MIFDYEMAGYSVRRKDSGLFHVPRSGFFRIATEDQKRESSEQFFPLPVSLPAGGRERVCRRN